MTIKDAYRMYWDVTYTDSGKKVQFLDDFYETVWDWEMHCEDGKHLTGQLTTQYDSRPLTQNILRAAVDDMISLMTGFSVTTKN